MTTPEGPGALYVFTEPAAGWANATQWRSSPRRTAPPATSWETRWRSPATRSWPAPRTTRSAATPARVRLTSSSGRRAAGSTRPRPRNWLLPMASPTTCSVPRWRSRGDRVVSPPGHAVGATLNAARLRVPGPGDRMDERPPDRGAGGLHSPANQTSVRPSRSPPMARRSPRVPSAIRQLRPDPLQGGRLRLQPPARRGQTHPDVRAHRRGRRSECDAWRAPLRSRPTATRSSPARPATTRRQPAPWRRALSSCSSSRARRGPPRRTRRPCSRQPTGVGSGLGDAVAITGNTVYGLAVGGADERIYAFTEPSTGWAPASEAASTASPAESGDGTSFPITASGATLVVGAPQHPRVHHRRGRGVRVRRAPGRSRRRPSLPSAPVRAPRPEARRSRSPART